MSRPDYITDRIDREARARELLARLDTATGRERDELAAALRPTTPHPSWCYQPAQCAGRLSCAGRSCLD